MKSIIIIIIVIIITCTRKEIGSVGTLFFPQDLISLFLERGRWKEGEKQQCVVAHWGPGPQPRHVHRLGIKLWESNRRRGGSQAGA